MATSNNSAFPGLPAVPPEDPSLTTATNQTTPRKIKMAFLANEVPEGAGARVRRSVGTPKLRNFSPFLMLDHFSISKGAGFPDHPHRGQETITYMLSGRTKHEDFTGQSGTLHPGDLQFMTAGRGIVHAEMPDHEPGDDPPPVVGMQLWVDLPQKLKLCEPRYRDLLAKEIPTVSADDGKVSIKIISGMAEGVESVKELAYTPVWILDITIKKGGRLVQKLPKGWNAFAYLLQGTAQFDPTGQKPAIPQYHNVVFEQAGDSVVMQVDENATTDARIYLVAGLPLDQKVVQYGPFVLNSEDEVYQAMHDYQGFTNGFERARDWQSEIGKAMVH